MKKIEIQLSARQLNTLVYFFNLIGYTYPKTMEEKATKSILDEVIVKIKKKHIDVESSVNTIFSKPKKPKFTFKYHEAYSLEKYILFVETQALNDYDRNVALYIKTKLNQQLV